MAEASEQVVENIERQAERRAKSKNLAPLRALKPFLMPYRGMIAAAGLALAVAAAATLVMPIAVRGVIDHGFSAEDASRIGQYFLALIAVAGVLGCAAAIRFYLVTWIGERVTADVRAGVFNHMLSLSPNFFETTRTGEVLSRLTADTTLIQVVVGSSASFALRNTVMGIGAIIMMIVTSPKLAALCLIGVPLVVLPIVLFGRRVRKLSRESQDRIADTSAYAGEALNAIATVQAFTHEDVDRANFTRAVEDSFIAAIKRTRMRAVMTAFVIFLVGSCIVGVLWAGATDVLAGRMTGGELSQFVLYAVLLASGTGALSETWGDVQRAAGATERLMEILVTEPSVKPPPNPVPLPKPARGAVRFVEVSRGEGALRPRVRHGARQGIRRQASCAGPRSGQRASMRPMWAAPRHARRSPQRSRCSVDGHELVDEHRPSTSRVSRRGEFRTDRAPSAPRATPPAARPRRRASDPAARARHGLAVVEERR